jgi:hypothetical protein
MLYCGRRREHRMKEQYKISTEIKNHGLIKEPALKKTMSVPEMRKLLGLKKTEGYWLVHREFFKTEIIGGMMRVDIESFEKWYANQVKHKKVDGEEPGKELIKGSYSFQDAANLLGVNNACLYEIWKREERKTIKVDFVKRIPKEEFENWLSEQTVYKKSDRIPTISDMEKGYIRFKETARMLNIQEDTMLKLIRTSKYKAFFEVRVFDNKKWISKKSFRLFLNAQNEYRITDNDENTSSDNLIIETKEYISRNEAAELAGVKASTITKWIQAEAFPCVGAGKVLRIKRADFLAWLNESRKVRM